MRKMIIILGLILIAIGLIWLARPTFANPDVAFDAFSIASSTTNISYTHTPVGTPRGVLVMCIGTAADTDEFTSATYGGTSMSEVSGSPNVLTGTGHEGGDITVFFLGSSVPTGAQTVAVTVSGTGVKTCAAVSLTASTDTEVVDSDGTINSVVLDNPSVTLSLGSRVSFAVVAVFSGLNNLTNITPLTGWTGRFEEDFGSDVAGWYTYNTIGSTDVTAGWTQAGNDALMIAVAVSEVQAAAGGGGEEYLILLES